MAREDADPCSWLSSRLGGRHQSLLRKAQERRLGLADVEDAPAVLGGARNVQQPALRQPFARKRLRRHPVVLVPGPAWDIDQYAEPLTNSKTVAPGGAPGPGDDLYAR